jgi:hypothetical protein
MTHLRLPVHRVLLYSSDMSNDTMTATMTGNVSAITEHPACGGGTVRVRALWEVKQRCPGCTHRQTVDDVPPKQTRKEPWRAPAELLGRHLAKKAA